MPFPIPPVQRAFGVAALLCLFSPPFMAVEPAAPSEFVQEVTAHFKEWDTDQDNALSANEIELAVADPKVKGPAAGAAAALRRAIRADSKIAPLTMAKITGAEPTVTTAKPAANPANAPANPTEDAAPAGGKPLLPHLEFLYKAAMTRINATPRQMFTTGKPLLDDIGQGHLGDCFLIVGLGVLTETDPERLKKMLEPKSDGTVAVHLGTGRTLQITAPTDGEIVLGVRTRDTGVWGGTFEKAIGTVYLERQKTRNHVTPLSIVGVGGSPHTPVELITGHQLRRAGCEDFRKPDLTEPKREEMFTELRKKLTDAFTAKRLVVGGNGPLHTGGAIVVPGLYYNHSYGVLGYDAKTDLVTFWNPFGNTYTPKGPPGLKFGYPTSHGRFQVALTEAVWWFGSFSIETTEPLKS